jgi:hypothetical protein
MILRSDPEVKDDSVYDPSMSIAEVERRQHERSLRVMRVARLAALDAEGLGMVRDVSSGGMMIDAHIELDIGQQVSIAMLDDQELSGSVAWKDGSMIGVQFAAEVDVEEILAKPSVKPDGKRARHPRFAAGRAAQVKIDESVLDATLLDISQRGAKLECTGKVRANNNVVLRTDGLKPVAATVKWRAGDMMGIEFHRLLPVGELEHWLKV